MQNKIFISIEKNSALDCALIHLKIICQRFTEPYCDKSTLYQHCTLAIFQIKREINLASESHHTRPCRGRHVCSMTFVFFLIDYCNPQSFGLQSKLLDLFSFLAMRVAYSVPLIWSKKAQMSHFSQYLQRSFGEI